MSNSRRDYEATAEIIRKFREDFLKPESALQMARHFAAYYQPNPRFDQHRFLVACGVTQD